MCVNQLQSLISCGGKLQSEAGASRSAARVNTFINTCCCCMPSSYAGVNASADVEGKCVKFGKIRQVVNSFIQPHTQKVVQQTAQPT